VQKRKEWAVALAPQPSAFHGHRIPPVSRERPVGNALCVASAADERKAVSVTDRQRELHERLHMPEAILTRSDLADLGYPRRAVDVIFKHVIREGAGVQVLPGFSRPMIRVGDFLAFRDRHSHRERVSP
jgi:hypothetical protein